MNQDSVCRKQQLRQRLETLLYHDLDGFRSFLEKNEDPSQDGMELKFCRLVPSFSDRKAFNLCVTEGVKVNTEDPGDSMQVQAKLYFDAEIRSRLSSIPGNDDPLSLLESLTECALERMGLTLVEVLNEINLTQVFLWLQEKSLMGEGALLYNPTPGVAFTAADLVRNLIMASVIQDTLERQESFYRHKWLFPIEKKCLGPEHLTKVIHHYVEQQTKK